MQRAAPPASAYRRPDRGPRSIVECKGIAELARRASRLDALDRALRQTLPTALRDQTRFADLRNDRLVFLVSSPAWASRLRLMQTQLLATALALGTRASSITVKVVPPVPTPVEPDRTKPLSPTAATHLQAAAASVTDPELKALFLDLASLAPKSR